jgi:hypothetical protein
MWATLSEIDPIKRIDTFQEGRGIAAKYLLQQTMVVVADLLRKDVVNNPEYHDHNCRFVRGLAGKQNLNNTELSHFVTEGLACDAT